MKEEKERGITIKSAAITLNLKVKQSLLPKNKSSNNDSSRVVETECRTAQEENHRDISFEIYVGNLPTGLCENRFQALLENLGVTPGSVGVAHWNAKRGFGVVRGKKELANKLLALDNAVSLQGRTLVFQERHGDDLSLLQMACQQNKVEFPNISVCEETNTGLRGGERFSGVASWPAMGGVLVQGNGRFETQKKARQAAARECLRFLRKQQADHPQQTTPAQTEPQAAARDATDKVQACAVGEKEGEADEKMVPLVVNLIDTPGHIEFNGEVTAALRVCDGALLVVDAVEGMAVGTCEVLKQALHEGIKPVLMLNKVDRLFLKECARSADKGVQKIAEEVYDAMQRVVDHVNDFITVHQLKNLPDQRVSFAEGSVCFGSGYFGWSCTIDSFMGRFREGGIQKEQETLRKLLSNRENFVRHIIRPIIRMHRASGFLPLLKGASTGVDRVARVTDLLSELGASSNKACLFKTDEDMSSVDPPKLLKKAMMAWLPAADALVDMVAVHTPSPIKAQKVRAELLYSGEIGDECGQGIRGCDPSAPSVVYISKMVRAAGLQAKRLLAFGRVFSGTVHPGDVLRALLPDGTESTARISQIKMFGIKDRMHSIPAAVAGQLVALEGIDQILNKAGTLTSSSIGQPIRHTDTAVTPILQHSIKPKNKRDLTKMVSELALVTRTDSTAIFYKDKETGELILAGSGGLHIEVLVSRLREESGIEVDLSDPIIAYRETVHSAVANAVLAKSSNKHNRVFIKASPLPSGVVEGMASGDLVGLDPKTLGRELMSRYGWSSGEGTRIWATGPEPLGHGDTNDRPTCILVDSTFGLQLPQDAKENITAAFMQLVRKGVLVNCPMRGIRFDLVDAKFHSDSVHRRPHSVVPAAVRAMTGAFLSASPGLVEPIYRADIRGALGRLNPAYSILGRRSGTILDADSTPTTDVITASLPVRCAAGLSGELRGATQGHALCTCVYSCMEQVPESEEDGIVLEARRAKGLDAKVPVAEEFIERLH